MGVPYYLQIFESPPTSKKKWENLCVCHDKTFFLADGGALPKTQSLFCKKKNPQDPSTNVSLPHGFVCPYATAVAAKVRLCI